MICVSQLMVREFHMGGGKCVANLLYGILVVICCYAVRLNAQGFIGEFISIDCGSEANYTDSLGIVWSTDSGYIFTGQNAYVDTSTATLGADRSQDAQKLSTVRYFPEARSKHCYVIPEVQENSLYLIRVAFLGSNFTSAQNQAVNFVVTVNTYSWINVTISDPPSPLFKELIFGTGAGPFSLCLVPRIGIPFISSLELRQLPSTAYQGADGREFAFTGVFRLNCGTSPTSPRLRYPDDRYDRFWSSDPPSLGFTRFSNFSAEIDLLSNISAIPTTVLQSAWTAPRASSLNFSWPVPNDSLFIVYFLYFAEITSPPKNARRELEAYVDDSLVEVFDVTTKVHYMINFTLSLSVSSINVEIVPTNTSTLGPMLNAIEVYTAEILNTSYTTWAADVTVLSTIQQQFNLLDWTGDPCLPIAWDWLQCSPSSDTSSGTIVARVTQVDLSGYHLTGHIPSDIEQLTELRNLLLGNNSLSGPISNINFPATLEILQLQNNHLEGPIPESLTTLANLTVLNLDYNNLSGDVPQGLLNAVIDKSLTFSAAGNPQLCLTGSNCTSPSEPPSSPHTGTSPSSNSNSNVGIVIGAIAAGVVVVLLLFMVLFICYKRRNPAPKVDPPSDLTPGRTVESVFPDRSRYNQEKTFSLMEVKSATDNFAKLIGTGGFGSVYYGKLSDGQEVAVKVNKGIVGREQGTAEFLNEVELLTRVHHRNLVSLVGYCDEPGQQILLYEFMPQGTLREHIYCETKTGVALDWKTRLDVALNAARGLEYLHNSCSPPIIHRDVKSNNILLTDMLLAKVADFGISKITTDDNRTRGVTTQIKGTHGYLDPEYFMQQRLTTKSDVYSFGVVLLELVTGRKPTEISFPGSTSSNLHDWVRDSVRDGNIHAVIDPALGRNYNVESVWKVVETALLSMDRHGARRPDMKEVVRSMTEALELEVHYIQTPVTYHSPSQINRAEYDSYQPLHDTRHSRSRASRTGSSNESVATYSSGSIVIAR